MKDKLELNVILVLYIISFVCGIYGMSTHTWEALALSTLLNAFIGIIGYFNRS